MFVDRANPASKKKCLQVRKQQRWPSSKGTGGGVMFDGEFHGECTLRRGKGGIPCYQEHTALVNLTLALFASSFVYTIEERSGPQLIL